MSNNNLKYIGPVSTLQIGNKSQPLISGEIYTNLPLEQPIVANLCAQGLLIEVSDDGSNELSGSSSKKTNKNPKE